MKGRWASALRAFGAISLKGWKLHQVWEQALSYTHCNLAAKFRPFLSQAEQAGLAAPHAGLQDCASALFHTQQSQHPSLSISHSDVAPQFLLELFFFFFFFHSPWGKKPIMEWKISAQTNFKCGKITSSWEQDPKEGLGCWTSLTPPLKHTLTHYGIRHNSTNRNFVNHSAYIICKSPSHSMGPSFHPYGSNYRIGTQSLWDKQKRKKWVSQDHCEYSPTSLHSDGHHQPP